MATGYRANSGMQSVVATWQCLIKAHALFIMIDHSLISLKLRKVSLDSKLDYSYGLILEVSCIHIHVVTILS